MTDDPAHHLNLLKCQADFIYRMTVRAIRILDTGSVAGFRIMYRDPDGYWDGVKWDGSAQPANLPYSTFLANGSSNGTLTYRGEDLTRANEKSLTQLPVQLHKVAGFD